MARAEVGRPSVGTVAQERSETAARAYVAAHLAQDHGTPFLKGLGLTVNTSAVGRAGRRLLWHPPRYKPPGRTLGTGPRSTAVSTRGRTEAPLREWLDVQPAALAVAAAAIILEFGTRRQQLNGYRRVQGILGVVQAATLSPSGIKQTHRVLVIALLDDPEDRDRLETAVARLCNDWTWHDVTRQTVEPAIRTWQELTRAAAGRESLLG